MDCATGTVPNHLKATYFFRTHFLRTEILFLPMGPSLSFSLISYTELSLPCYSSEVGLPKHFSPRGSAPDYPVT